MEAASISQRFHLDLPLVFGLTLLAGLGLLVIYSAAGEDQDLLARQALRLGIAFVAMVVLAQLTPRQYLVWTPWLYVGTVLLLIAVLLFGQEGKGAQRWIALGGLNFQPSEIAKVTVPMMVAYYLSDRPLPPGLKGVVFCGGLVVFPVLLIARQPDLGTALLIACSGFFVLFIAGVAWKVMLFGAMLLAAITPVAWSLMHDYQRSRVITFFDPEQDPLGAGYHIIQSKIAIGSGGVYGKGWLNGTQSQLDFLPERSTDFIFAVYSEEFGLLGVLGLLTVYALIIARGLILAWRAQELFGRLWSISLVLTFFVYVFINVGMVSGLVPVVGVPLPLVSYGGTSLVTIMAAFGILMSMHSHRRLLSD